MRTKTAASEAGYAELHCLTNFTFLRGASHPDELVDRAAELGYAALAVTDECSLAGAARAHLAAKEKGLKLLLGAELRLEGGPNLVCLATDREGYGNLCEVITRGRRAAEKGKYRLRREDLVPSSPSSGIPGEEAQGGQGEACAAGGAATLKDPKLHCDASSRPPPAPPPPLEGCLVLLLPGETPSPEEARWVAEAFPGRAWIAVELLCGPDDRKRLRALRELGRRSGLPLVAAGDVHLHDPSRKELQDVLTAVRLGTPVDAAGYALHPNRERHLRARDRLARLYPPELLAETLRVADACRFSLDELRYEYPEEVVPPGEAAPAYLRRLVEEGSARRWPGGAPARVRDQLEHELALIAELGYERYFLTVYDLVRFARSRRILCQGRGSAANSAVCFCLGITEVDPSRQATLFERFISRERNEPPDIDIDFEHERREEVIQYVYGKYGRDRAALAATVITYRPKSALRDVGRALGFELDQVDRISRALAWWDRADALPLRLADAGFAPENPAVVQLLRLARELLGFPRHLSQHVGGFVISRGPLQRVVPIENAAMADRTVIEWDKDDLDALGLLKVDVLALGMLTALHKALDLVTELRGRPLGLADLPAEDRETYAMIREADTVGVFQIESRAQMAMLPRLRPETFYDLVVQVAIVRPGPIQGQMVHPYLKRRAGKEPVTYPSPEVREVLERTLGVPIFQEQVMKLAIVAAGFTPGEADGLRRGMAAWRRKGGIGVYGERLVAGMLARGYPEVFAQQIFQQIHGFAEYGFPESHAASFAHLAYASAWLKCHEPAAFACALLNSQPMGFYGPSQLVQDARRHGVEVKPVDVRVSGWECALEVGVGEGERDSARRNPTSDFRGGYAFDSAAFPLPAGSPSAGGEGRILEVGVGQGDLGSGPRNPTSDSKGGYADRSAEPPLAPSCRTGVRERRGAKARRARADRLQPSLRLGLRLVKGLSEAGARRLAAARAERPFADVEDLALRAHLSRKDLQCLADAGALEELAGHRRRARWAALGADLAPLPLFRGLPTPEPSASLPVPSPVEDLDSDYESLGLSLGPHPLALLRRELARRRMLSSAELARTSHGRRIRTAGLVVCRQRPDTASGVTFVTVEDEEGFINLVIWKDLAERRRKALLGARLLGVTGVLERMDGVQHVLAKDLEDLSPLLGSLRTRSRDFC